MTNPVRPPQQPSADANAAALAATALASEGQTNHAAMAAAAIAKRAQAAQAAQGVHPAEMRTSAPGFTPVPQHSIPPQNVPPLSRQSGQDRVANAAAPAQPPSSKKPDPYIGTTFDGRYQIEKRLGEGGMGVVYSAKHTMIGKRVAVKVLKNEYASDKDILDRFVQEARTASSIGNPHIVDISDFGTLPDGATYFVMELLEGESLADVVTPAGVTDPVRMDPMRICRIALQLCDGLGAAHARNIVHRDLKPDNIFLVKKVEPDFVKILDFGIAKVTNTATQKTRAGQVFGTPHYMSPEQAAGRGVDARSDLYSIGVILYEMATGVLPFTDETYMGILTAHMYRSPEPIRATKGLENFPTGLDAIIQKCLAKQPDLRYQSMAQLDADLRRQLGNEEPEAVSSLLHPPESGGESRASTAGATSRTTGAAPIAMPRSRASTMIIIAGLIAAAGLIAGALYLKKKLNADAAPLSSSTAAAATTTAAATSPPAETAAAPAATSAAAPTLASSAAPSTSASASGPALTHVVLKVIPASAKLSIDGKPLEKNEVDVDASSPVTVRVEAQGFAPQSIKVDGKQPEIALSLTPIGGAPPPTPKSSGGYHDVWKK